MLFRFLGTAGVKALIKYQPLAVNPEDIKTGNVVIFTPLSRKFHLVSLEAFQFPVYSLVKFPRIFSSQGFKVLFVPYVRKEQSGLRTIGL